MIVQFLKQHAKCHVLKLFWTLFDYVMAREMYKFSPLFVLQVMKSWVGPRNEITERLQDTITFREIKRAALPCW